MPEAQSFTPQVAHLGKQGALDGLRAIAVVAVMAYHFGLGGTRGAYVGVDIFFALSGFLITTLMLEESPFSRPAFYVRRAFRLLPSLFALLVALLILLPSTGHSSQLHEYYANAGLALAYITNWGLIVHPQLHGPVIDHLWSLAIEEQFYLLWPIALAAIVRRYRRPLTPVLAVIAALAVWTLVLIAFGASVDRIYLGTDTRADMLLIGCAFALARSSGGLVQLQQRLTRSWVTQVVPLAMMLVIVVGVGQLHQTSLVEWSNSMTESFLASITLLGLIAGPQLPVARLLSTRPIAHIGKISYELYLWHYPICFSLASTGFGLKHGVERAAAWGLASLLAAELTHRLVSMPIQARRPAWARGGPRLTTQGSITSA